MPTSVLDAYRYFGPEGVLSNALSGFSFRSSQMQMAQAVDNVLHRDGILLAEAGTGTGKTLAYLLPALLSERKLVISTGTKTLQDQIVKREIPALTEAIGVHPKVECMKGLSNYVCRRRFHELQVSTARPRSPNLPLLEHFVAHTLIGDRAELAHIPEEDPTWLEIQSGSDTRIGPRCDFFEPCFVTRMRQRAEDAQLIVVNHHLFFADLAMKATRKPGVLPEFEAVIFDEAHQLEDVATQFFGVQLSASRMERLVRDAERSYAAADLVQESAPALKNLLARTSDFFALLGAQVRSATPNARVSLPPEALTTEVKSAFFELDTALTLLVERSRKHASKSESIAGIAKRTAALREDLSRIIDCLGSDYVAWVKWKGRRCTIGASPVDVSGTLRDELFHRARAVVLTSATLSTSGRFDFIRGRLGLADEDVAEFMAPSPFDYPRQAGLYVAGEIPDPRSTEYARIALKEIERLIRIAKGGAFVLCTSTRAMETLAVELRLILNSDYKILVQGEESKNTLLDRFRQDEGSVLVGTGTFWEGVDVPGNALRLVILDKLPFGVPTDPLVEARCSRLAAQGQAPFMKYLVPTAALALKQGFGRLIRSESDRGVVAILDSRLVKKGYGRLLLRSLPRARKCSTLDEVQYFFRHMQDDSVDREGSTPL